MKHTDEAKRFYNSKAWKKCRQSYISKVHGLCERCEQTGTIVHHKEYITIDNINDPDILLNYDNLELLCHSCHNKEHFKKYESIRECFGFDSEGNLVEVV